MSRSRSAKDTKKTAKKVARKIEEGIAHIACSFNNVVVSFTDNQGQVLGWSSSGAHGFKGRRRATPFAAQTTVTELVKKLVNFGLKKVQVYVKGPGGAKESAVRAIESNGISVNVIHDVTPIPHNGCRPSKQRRV